MNHRTDGERLLDEYLDGELEGERIDAFIAWLRMDRAHVRLFVHASRMESSLARMDIAALMQQAVVPRIEPRVRRTMAWWVGLASAGLAATGLVATIVAMLWMPSAGPGVLPVAAVRPVAWTELHVVSGGVLLDGQRQATGELLQPDTALTTIASAPTVVGATDGTQFTFQPNSRFVVPGPGHHLDLLAGSLHAEVAPQLPRAPVRLQTSHMAVTVIGTKFDLQATAAGTALTLIEGHVGVVDPLSGRYQQVSAGNSVRIPAAAVIDRGLVTSSLSLVDVANHKTLLQVQDGARMVMADVPASARLNVRAIYAGRQPGSVRFTITGDHREKIDATKSVSTNVEEHPPWNMVFDNGKDRVADWRPEPGTYLLCVTPFSLAAGKGAPGVTLVVGFTVAGNRAGSPTDLAVPHQETK